jgi:hypothetical protein
VSKDLRISADGDGVVSMVGAAALRMLADRTDLTQAKSEILARPGFRPVHDRGRILTDSFDPDQQDGWRLPRSGVLLQGRLRCPGLDVPWLGAFSNRQRDPDEVEVSRSHPDRETQTGREVVPVTAWQPEDAVASLPCSDPYAVQFQLQRDLNQTVVPRLECRAVVDLSEAANGIAVESTLPQPESQSSHQAADCGQCVSDLQLPRSLEVHQDRETNPHHKQAAEQQARVLRRHGRRIY